MEDSEIHSYLFEIKEINLRQAPSTVLRIWAFAGVSKYQYRVFEGH